MRDGNQFIMLHDLNSNCRCTIPTYPRGQKPQILPPPEEKFVDAETGEEVSVPARQNDDDEEKDEAKEADQESSKFQGSLMNSRNRSFTKEELTEAYVYASMDDIKKKDKKASVLLQQYKAQKGVKNPTVVNANMFRAQASSPNCDAENRQPSGATDEDDPDVKKSKRFVNYLEELKTTVCEHAIAFDDYWIILNERSWTSGEVTVSEYLRIKISPENTSPHYVAIADTCYLVRLGDTTLPYWFSHTDYEDSAIFEFCQEEYHEYLQTQVPRVNNYYRSLVSWEDVSGEQWDHLFSESENDRTSSPHIVCLQRPHAHFPRNQQDCYFSHKNRWEFCTTHPFGIEPVLLFQSLPLEPTTENPNPATTSSPTPSHEPNPNNETSPEPQIPLNRSPTDSTPSAVQEPISVNPSLPIDFHSIHAALKMSEDPASATAAAGGTQAPRDTAPFNDDAQSSVFPNMTTKERGVKPEKFTGDRNQTKDWIAEFNNYLRLNDQVYPTEDFSDSDKEYTSTEEDSSASKPKTKGKSWTLREVKREFLRDFKPSARETQAQTKIEHIKMEGALADIDKYNSQFKRYADDTGYNDKALMKYYRKGLPRGLVDRISYLSTQPRNLAALQKAAVKQHMIWLERQEEKTSWNKPRREEGQPGRRSQGTGSSRTRSMEVNTFQDNTPGASSITKYPPKLTPQERDKMRKEGRCFRCRGQGHMGNDCPTFPSTPPTTPNNTTWRPSIKKTAVVTETSDPKVNTTTDNISELTARIGALSGEEKEGLLKKFVTESDF
ncbi:hypothetical protein D9758_016167 [Tetrapyrgos nigripes]|uniref:CCHC-type domain-containing protein n=1 Tax=Tetrapyrgos nigripes TaxID=182062 RepID=A0A8H5CIE2_9AGAR|nr:hypothetical protein D9758_016167 [Tetrapyrgos nigripes]